MIDANALAGRLEAQDRLIATLLAAVVEGQVVTQRSLADAVDANAKEAAARGNHSAATILRHRAKALRTGLTS